MESILNSIKKMLGLSEDYNHFDDDLIIHINSVFMVLQQLGVGPKEGYFIVDDSETWNDYIDDVTNIQAIKTYIFLKTKLFFDPPLSASVLESYNKLINELEWRLNVSVDQTNNGDQISDCTHDIATDEEVKDIIDVVFENVLSPEEPPEPNDPDDTNIATDEEVQDVINDVFS